MARGDLKPKQQWCWSDLKLIYGLIWMVEKLDFTGIGDSKQLVRRTCSAVFLNSSVVLLVHEM